MKDLRIELMSWSKNDFYSLQFKAFKYNRTTTAHNATFIFKKDVGDKVEMLCQVTKFLSNEYRHFPIRFQSNLRKLVNADVMGMSKLKNCGNLGDFVFSKNVTYYACNFVIDETRFPPLIPDGKYRIEVQLLHLDKEIVFAHIYTEIYTPIPYPKK